MDEEYATIVSVKTLNSIAGLDPRSVFAFLYRRCLTKAPVYPASAGRVVSMAGAYIPDVERWLVRVERAGYSTSSWLRWDAGPSPKARITVGQLNQLLSCRYQDKKPRKIPYADALFVVYLMAVSTAEGRIPDSVPKIVGLTGLKGHTVSIILGRLRKHGLVVENWLVEFLRRSPRQED